MANDAMAYFGRVGETLGMQLAAALLARAPARTPNGVGASAMPAAGGRGPGGVRAVALARRATRGRTKVGARLRNFAPGALVRYRQGRGTFDAEILKIDAAGKLATIQRMSDLKRLVRPLSKLLKR